MTSTPTCTTTIDSSGARYGVCDDGTTFGESVCAPLAGVQACPASMPATGTHSPTIAGGATVLLLAGVILARLAQRRTV